MSKDFLDILREVVEETEPSRIEPRPVISETDNVMGKGRIIAPGTMRLQ